jgi:hypothetical protein
MSQQRIFVSDIQKSVWDLQEPEAKRNLSNNN